MQKSIADYRQQVAVDIKGAAALLGVSEDAIRDLMDTVTPIPYFTYGRRKIIPVADLVDWASHEATTKANQ